VNGTPREIKRYDADGILCYRREDAAQLLRVHYKTIGRRQRRGKLGCVEHLGHKLVPCSDIDGKPQGEYIDD
jgi:hypothetical protein